MKIVIGCDTVNPYVHQLTQSLASHQEVESAEDSLYKFWQRPDDVDVLHIQWPEALYNWKSPQPWEVVRLEYVLEEWSSKACIVTTVHNYEPHNIENYERLYRLVYQASDGIVHLGEASRDWFFDQYDFASKKHHAIIPHGNYTCFPNHVAPAEARNRLDLSPDDYVCLCFGKIRDHSERALLVEAFDRLSGWRKKLVIAGGGAVPLPSSHSFQHWRIRCDPRLRIHDDWIPDEDVQLYLNAADVMVIPRNGVLNSGNVALGFTFGRTVVGPDEGVIGEVLRKTGNPTYEPGNAQALAEALERVRGSGVQRAARNSAYAAEKMNWQSISYNHLETYEKIE